MSELPLRWSREKPCQPGVYYYRETPAAEVALVCIDENMTVLFIPEVHLDGREETGCVHQPYAIDEPGLFDGEWASPLEPPR